MSGTISSRVRAGAEVSPVSGARAVWATALLLVLGGAPSTAASGQAPPPATATVSGDSDRDGTGVLALEPEHAGASYMLGKLHASVLRLGGVKRFLATTLFGGGALENASWEDARSLLEQSVRGDPCVPEHHFELARVYAHDGNVGGWERELSAVFELTEGGDARASRLRARAEGFQKEWRQKGAGA